MIISNVTDFIASSSSEVLITLVALAGMSVVWQCLRIVQRLLEKDSR